MRAKAAEQVFESDPRPPIVYLRPFDFDRNSSIATMGGTGRLFALGGTKTYEQRVARALRRVAPTVAVGDPTEGLPELGVVRLYADDAKWQRTIEDLTGRGGTIILHVGDSEGLAWEVSHVVGLGQPERIILSFGGASASFLGASALPERIIRIARYAKFRRRFGHIFPRGLPEIKPQRFGPAFLYFDADWTPQVFDWRVSRTLDAPPGCPGEQRAMALRRLAFEFRLKPNRVYGVFGFFLLIVLGFFLLVVLALLGL
jgi:hypothetical protein